MTEQNSHQVGLSSDISENARKYIEDANSVGVGSEARDYAYFIRATEDGGLPVDIVGLSLEEFYIPYVDSNAMEPMISEVSEFSVESMVSDYGDSSAFAVHYSPVLSVYYRIPSGSVLHFNVGSHEEFSSPSRQGKEFLRKIMTEVQQSPHHSSINDISEGNAIDATIHPDECLTDGRIKINDVEVEVNSTYSEVVPSDSISSRKLDFITSYSSTVSEMVYTGYFLNSANLRWFWGYVSDMYESEDGEEVYIEVSTPLGSAIFPFKLSYDVDDNPIWSIIEEAGGDLQDVRGMDVCVRLRSETVFYRTEIISSDYSFMPTEFVELEQPFSSDATTNWLFNSVSNEVEEVATDSDFIWDLGIPVEDRFSSMNHTTETDREEIDSTSTQESSDEGFVRSLLSL